MRARPFHFLAHTVSMKYTAPMVIRKAEFTWGVVYGNEPWDVNVPQVVFYGRSNAGKSSAINTIVNNKTLAKSSATPGKTQQINFFNINDSFYLVDLPGYGYAKISKQQKEKLQNLIFWFMTETRVAKRTHVLIADAKLGLTELDREVLDYLYRTGDHIIILLNKIDKLKQREIAQVVADTKNEVAERADVIPFSAHAKRGVKEFWNTLQAAK